MTHNEGLLRVAAAFEIELSDCWNNGRQALPYNKVHDGQLFLEVRYGEFYRLNFSFLPPLQYEAGIQFCTENFDRYSPDTVKSMFRRYQWIAKAFYLLGLYRDIATEVLNITQHQTMEWTLAYEERYETTVHHTMKEFAMKELKDAYEHAAEGGQALHVHTLTHGHPLFEKYPEIAHLFDQDQERLKKTAQKLGVNVIKVEYPNTKRQHIDLCGKPFERARQLCRAKIPLPFDLEMDLT